MKKIVLSTLLTITTSYSFGLSMIAPDVAPVNIESITTTSPSSIGEIIVKTLVGPSNLETTNSKIPKVNLTELRAKLPIDVQTKLANFNPRTVNIAALRAKLRK